MSEEPKDDRWEAAAGAPANERAREIVEIAFRHVAERGFEGLRIRAVAAEAGINHATLLYHFPNKEALIQGVVAHLAREFRVPHLPEGVPKPRTAFEELALELEDGRRRFREHPEIVAVLSELEIRSRRNRVIADILGGLYRGWREHLIGILDRGILEGVIRADIDKSAVASMFMAQFKGIFGLQITGVVDEKQIADLVAEFSRQLDRWLTPPSDRTERGKEV